MSEVMYQEPLSVTEQSECFFYHYMDLPGVGPVGGDWDLRGCIDEYLGRCDYRGKRALDVGTASGFLTFEMEKRGAEVVSFDMPDARSWNLVPSVNVMSRYDDLMAELIATHERLRNSYWFAHRQHESKAKAYYGDVYDLPAGLGTFDIVIFGTILAHLRDPLAALYSAARLCGDTIVLSDFWMPEKRGEERPLAILTPSVENRSFDCWWQLSVACAEQFLSLLGFRLVRTVKFEAKCSADGQRTQRIGASLVAKRVAGHAI